MRDLEAKRAKFRFGLSARASGFEANIPDAVSRLYIPSELLRRRLRSTL